MIKAKTNRKIINDLSLQKLLFKTVADKHFIGNIGTLEDRYQSLAKRLLKRKIRHDYLKVSIYEYL